MIAHVVRRFTAILLAVACSSACTKDSPRRTRGGSAPKGAGSKTDDSAAGSIDLGGVGYRATSLSAVGSVGGTIRVPDAVAGDTATAAVDTTPAAGSAVDSSKVDSTETDTTETDTTEMDTSPADVRGTARNAMTCDPKLGTPAGAPKKTFANTIVWIADVKTGKPIPIDKRAELSSEKCILDPRVQAVVVGTTVNVVNDDRMLHKLVFMKLGTHDTLTVTPFFNAGQIVATERLAKRPGIVVVRCVQHPWTRAYIAVFDHPYFAVTAPNGTFKIDSLAPGSYKMMVWREGASKPVEQQIQITSGGMAKVDLTLK